MLAAQACVCVNPELKSELEKRETPTKTYPTVNPMQCDVMQFAVEPRALFRLFVYCIEGVLFGGAHAQQSQIKLNK